MSLPVMMREPDSAHLCQAIKKLPDDAVIVEWGSGGSTVMIAREMGPQMRLYTVEHTKMWMDKVAGALADEGLTDRVTQIFAPLAFPVSLWKFGHPEEETPAGADFYIDPRLMPETEFPLWSKIDLALVDGLARGPILAALALKTTPRIPVFLHDYVGREAWYNWAVRFYDQVLRVDELLELRRG